MAWVEFGANSYGLVRDDALVGVAYWQGAGPRHLVEVEDVVVLDPSWFWVSVDTPFEAISIPEAPSLGGLSDDQVVSVTDEALETVLAYVETGD